MSKRNYYVDVAGGLFWTVMWLVAADWIYRMHTVMWLVLALTGNCSVCGMDHDYVSDVLSARSGQR